MKTRRGFAALAGALSLAGLAAVAPTAAAQGVWLGGTLSWNQEVPTPAAPLVMSPASGTSSLFYNQMAGTILVQMQVSGLTGTTVGVGPGGAPAHIHLGFPGENGGIVVPLVGAPVGVNGFTYSSTFTFAELLAIGVPAADVTTLQTRLNNMVGAPLGTPAGLYANVHTTVRGAGEVRANLFVTPEPGTVALLGTGLFGLGLFGLRRQRRNVL